MMEISQNDEISSVNDKTYRNFALTILGFIPSFAFLYSFIVSPLLIFSPFSGEEGGSIDTDDSINVAVSAGNLTNKVFWTSMMFITLFFLLRSNIKKINLSFPMIMVGVYLAWALCSISWSDESSISFRRLSFQITMIISIFAPVMAGIRPEVILRNISIVFGLIVIVNCSLVPLVGIPDFGYHGIYGQKNGMGQVAFVATAILFWRCRQKGSYKLMWSALALGALLLCVISKSKTAMGLLLVIPVMVAIIGATCKINKVMGDIVLLMWGLVFIFIIIICDAFSFSIYDLSYLIFKDRTFTGRVEIWEFARLYIESSPYIGYGYASFWGVGESSAALTDTSSFISGLLQAHNGYIDIVLETGYIGLSIIFIFILSLFKEIFAAIRDGVNFSYGMMFLTLFVLLSNFMESSIFRSDNLLWMTLLLVVSFLTHSQSKENYARDAR